MEDKQDIYTKEYIINKGINFEELWFSSTSDEILDSPEDEGGKPYTGLTYELYDNGIIRYFSIYQNGFKHGLLREFHKNGNVKSEEIMRYGQTRGKRTVWNENGQVRSIGEYELGIELSYKEWDNEENLVESRILQESDDNHKYLISQREFYKKLGRY